MCVYGYCRISTKQDRPKWNKLYKKVKAGDIIVFDSVSRMSINADKETMQGF